MRGNSISLSHGEEEEDEEEEEEEKKTRHRAQRNWFRLLLVAECKTILLCLVGFLRFRDPTMKSPQ